MAAPREDTHLNSSKRGSNSAQTSFSSLCRRGSRTQGSDIDCWEAEKIYSFSNSGNRSHRLDSPKQTESNRSDSCGASSTAGSSSNENNSCSNATCGSSSSGGRNSYASFLMQSHTSNCGASSSSAAACSPCAIVKNFRNNTRSCRRAFSNKEKAETRAAAGTGPVSESSISSSIICRGWEACEGVALEQHLHRQSAVPPGYISTAANNSSNSSCSESQVCRSSIIRGSGCCSDNDRQGCSERTMAESCSAFAPANAADLKRGGRKRISNVVCLNVYDLDPTISKYMNKIMRPLGAGAFHAGVEVYGVEFCYGQTAENTSGVTVNRPRRHPAHIYRETVIMGETPLSPEDFWALMEVLKREWLGENYHVLTRNCLNFADQLCVLLGVGGLPSWLLRLQRQAVLLQERMQDAASRIRRFDETVGITAAASAAAAAAAATARAFTGLLIHSDEGCVGARVDQALNAGISYLSCGFGLFAEGVFDGLAGVSPLPEEYAAAAATTAAVAAAPEATRRVETELGAAATAAAPISFDSSAAFLSRDGAQCNRDSANIGERCSRIVAASEQRQHEDQQLDGQNCSHNSYTLSPACASFLFPSDVGDELDISCYNAGLCVSPLSQQQKQQLSCREKSTDLTATAGFEKTLPTSHPAIEFGEAAGTAASAVVGCPVGCKMTSDSIEGGAARETKRHQEW